jgi:hypothetical protein
VLLKGKYKEKWINADGLRKNSRWLESLLKSIITFIKLACRILLKNRDSTISIDIAWYFKYSKDYRAS